MAERIADFELMCENCGGEIPAGETYIRFRKKPFCDAACVNEWTDCPPDEIPEDTYSLPDPWWAYR